MKRLLVMALAVGVALMAASARARVVINEVMYHAPDDLDDLEYIELHNSGAEAVDIGGWSFSKGIKFTFARGTRLPAHGFLILARNADRLREFYSIPAAGTFTQKLSNDGEKLELTDASGAVVDFVPYDDRAPWPMGADGHSGSMERIDPESPGDNPANWASSPLSADRLQPGGSPMLPNSARAAKLPPVISNVRFAPDDPAPGQSISVEANVKHAGELKEVAILFRLAGPGFEKPETSVSMEQKSQSHFVGVIPGQGKDQLVRFRIRATDAAGVTRFYPAETEPRPAFSYYVHDSIQPAKIPFAWIINTTPTELSAARNRRDDRFGPWAPNRANPRMPFRSAFVSYDPATRKTQLFDFVQVNPRRHGRKVHFYSDQPFDEMTGINLIYEDDERFPLTEMLAYEVYRRAGMAAEKSYHMRTWVNGQPLGFQLLVEQPNRGFLRRNKISDDGNMYKLLWYERSLVGQHEKKTNTREGHDDLVSLVNELNATSDREQWEVIKKNFDVEQVATYFAVNMVLSYWDGYFNNYFTYHDVHGTGKWMMFPWDQDKTWGITDGRGRVFYDMPLTFGMTGDKPPGSRRSPAPGMMNFGDWWRPPGWFSGPLLANPYFRRFFLARTKDIIENVYSEKVMFPLIDDLGVRLRDEARIRAEIYREDPGHAVQRLENGLDWLREHLKKRRSFLLDQKELQNVALPD